MGRPTEITKKMLLDLGITEITRTGHVFQGNIEILPHILTKKTRYGIKQYKVIGVYSNEIYQEHRKTDPKATCGTKTIVLSRAIWAWHKGICPARMDVDHINNDSLDDRLDNYQLLTRSENLAKRKGNVNQYGLRKKDR